jgi:NAD+ synthase
MTGSNPLAIDPAAATEQLTATIREQVSTLLRRRGIVVGISGGVDSAVVTALAVRAVGAERVLGLLMPERDSSVESFELGCLVAKRFGVPTITENIAQVLNAVGCYHRQEEAIRMVFPEFGEGWKCKISLPPLASDERFNVFSLTVQSPAGELRQARPSAAAYLQLVAATSFKQRVRKMLEYYHADRLTYAVAGTPNRLEYDLGFFVKQGDGAADLKPIAHLYKTQVYALAAHLAVPREVCERPPTTDTYSLAQTQEEFYFALPYAQMDRCLWGYYHEEPAAEVAAASGLSAAQVQRAYADIRAKRRAAEYLHRQPILATSEAGAA